MSWPELLRLAAARFGLSPAQVWALSLVEWRALTAPPAGSAPLGRAAFEALAAAHPDIPDLREAP